MTGMQDLDDFLAAARRPAAPSEGLVARVLADADAAMPKAVAAEPVRLRSRWRRLVTAVTAALGGGVMATGLASAAMAGVAIGYAGPVTSDWLAAAVSQGSDVQVMAASDLFLGEG
ncbi:hypothetical protein MASR1M32_15790 [Rhodobacter sp.]